MGDTATRQPVEVTFSEAAALLGLRSRSTIYRLKDDGHLEHAGYLRGREGAWRIETHPTDHRPFVDWAAAVIGPQGPHRRSEQPPPDPWAHIPEALRSVDGSRPFWDEYGRLAGPDEPPLSDEAFWAEVAAMVSALMGTTYEPPELIELAWQLDDLREAVAAGARWDADRWDEASARSLLEDPDVMAGTCPHSRSELQALAAGGRLPPELQAQAAAALAAYTAREGVGT